MSSALVALSLLLLQAEPGQTAPAQAIPAQAAPAQPAPAQPAAPQAPPTAPAPAPGKTVRLAAGTLLEVELVAPLSSATSHLGDKFALRLATPISSDGVEVVAAGALGEGEVIDAGRAGMAGRAGKLILSARRMDLDGHSVRIHGMTLATTTGKSRVGLASGMLMVPYVGLAAGFVQGGEVEIPAGARYTVKLAEDVDLPINPPKDSEGKAQ
jgi:hypothetical protein